MRCRWFTTRPGTEECRGRSRCYLPGPETARSARPSSQQDSIGASSPRPAALRRAGEKAVKGAVHILVEKPGSRLAMERWRPGGLGPRLPSSPPTVSSRSAAWTCGCGGRHSWGFWPVWFIAMSESACRPDSVCWSPELARSAPCSCWPYDPCQGLDAGGVCDFLEVPSRRAQGRFEGVVCGGPASNLGRVRRPLGLSRQRPRVDFPSTSLSPGLLFALRLGRIVEAEGEEQDGTFLMRFNYVLLGSCLGWRFFVPSRTKGAEPPGSCWRPR